MSKREQNPEGHHLPEQPAERTLNMHLRYLTE
jgi:hypothetical protein